MTVADPLPVLLLGLLIGFVFGFLLQKGQVTRYPVILGQFLLTDFTVLKVMLTAVLVGGIGVYTLHAFGTVSLHVKPAQIAAVALGGAVFGVGMTVLGYCPGTGVAAAAEGRLDALIGVAGMLCGALVFAGQFASLQAGLLTWFDLGPVTLPQVTRLPAWLIFSALGLAAVALFRKLEAWEQARDSRLLLRK